MGKFKIGNSVTVTEGSMKGIFAIVVFLDEKQQKYLIRFSGNQQMYYEENQITLWGK